MFYLISLSKNKLTLISSAALILVPCYTWKILYYSYKNLRNKYERKLLHHKRHNCVVIFTENKGMSGWPPHTERLKLNIDEENCLYVFHKPILYFIDTAKKSLDIAFMLVAINNVYIALLEAHKRGVKIRLLLNFDHCDSKLSEIRNLCSEGIEVLTYISQKSGMSSIMHYKYMVKDYSEFNGYVSTGSLNLSESGFINNFESIIFMSDSYVVKAFYENFEECWNYIKNENKSLINQTILLDANLA